MEIPVINRLSDFEAGISSLQNPSFLSQSFSLSGVEKITQSYFFWKWGALILALLAIFRTMVDRIRISVIKFRQHNHQLVTEPLLRHLADDDDDYESDFDETSSSSSFEDDDDEGSVSSCEDWRRVDEDFSVKGSGNFLDSQGHNRNLKLRRRRSVADCFSWSEVFNGNSVVKLWDNLGLQLDLDSQSGNPISILESNSFIPAISTLSPAVIFSAGKNSFNDGALKIWDTRVESRVPAILSACRSLPGNVVDVDFDGVNKVYIRDTTTGELTVGDIRMPNAPLKHQTEYFCDGCFDSSALSYCDSAMTRWCDAVSSYLF